jgi:hypothetical protein
MMQSNSSCSPPMVDAGTGIAADPLENFQGMSMNTSTNDESAQTASDAGAFVQKAAHVGDGSSSAIGRVGAAASAVSVGARLLPAGMRLLRRYPIAGTLVVAGIALAIYSLRGRTTDEEY